VKGEAHKVIVKYPQDVLHYFKAWNDLLDHYNNPLKTVTKRLDTIFNYANVGTTSGKPPRKQTLRNVITKFCPNTTALQMTFCKKPEIDPVSQFLIYAFLPKSDQITHLKWEREIQKKSKLSPLWKDVAIHTNKLCMAFKQHLQVQVYRIRR
jgi:UDP-galactopyranose mutase